MAASYLLLLPPALLAASALFAWLPRVPARLATRGTGIGAWLAAAVLLALWAPLRTVREAAFPGLGAGINLGVRVDAVSVYFGLLIILPLALLLTLRATRRGDAGYAALAAAGSVLGMEASSLLFGLACWASSCTLLLLSPRHESSALSIRFWTTLTAAVLAWGLGAAVLLNGGSTTDYAAVPLSALNVPAFLLLVLPALWFSAALPWRSWLHLVWVEAGAISACTFAAVLVPVGFYVVMRAYQVGEGAFPHPVLNGLLIVIGLLVLLTAAYRAQLAPARSLFLLESLPFTSGFALVVFAVGSPLGLVAGLCALAGLALLIPLLALVAYDRGGPALLALALVAGLPPTLVFAGRLLAMQAAVDAGAIGAVAALLAGAGSLLLIAGAARAVRLPARAVDELEEKAVAGLPVIALGVVAVLGGGFVGSLVTELATPAAGQAMRFGAQPADVGAFSVATASGTWAALALVIPVLLVGVGLAVGRWGKRLQPVRPSKEPPRPLVGVGGAARFRNLAARIRLQPSQDPGQQLRLPEASWASPLALQLLVFAVLVLVVTRWST